MAPSSGQRIVEVFARTPPRIYALALLLPLAVIVAVALQSWIDPHHLWDDPIVAARNQDGFAQFYFGALSNIGVVMWSFASAVCLFAAPSARRLGRLEPARALRCAGLLSALLMADDLFLLHEDVFPHFLRIPKIFVYGLLSWLTAFYLVWYRGTLDMGDTGLLALAMLSFGVSLAVDVRLLDLGSVQRAVDIGAKFVGISLWLAFHLRLAWQLTAPDAAVGARSHRR